MRQIWQFNLILFTCLILLKSYAQTDSSRKQESQAVFSGFIDVFYAYDFNTPPTNNRQPFLYNHNRHNEANLNLGYIKLTVENTKYRFNFAPQAGTYVNDNYSAEPEVLKNLLEANVGVSVNKKNNLWLDAGIMPSHIGFESAVSSENQTLTRSLLAENSPYFFCGSKLTYSPNIKWEIAGLIMNGWQRIQRLSGNSLLSFGTQVRFSSTNKLKLNWSTFAGTDDPDTTRRIRCFNNFYAQLSATKKLNLTMGLDIGLQQKIKNGTRYYNWYSPVLIAQYNISKKCNVALRAEYYCDEKGVIIQTGTSKGFKTAGISCNIDYSPAKNILYRIEARRLESPDTLFVNKTNLSRSDFFVVASIAVKLSALPK